jgi:alpha-amylase
LQRSGIKAIADIVLNHRCGPDENADVELQYVEENDRNVTRGKPFVDSIPIRFTFAKRAGKYSRFIWDENMFTRLTHHNKPALILNKYTRKGWGDVMETLKGNYDYLLGYDVEFRNPAVREELRNWGAWYADTIKPDGFRIDAIKHIDKTFIPEWLNYIETSSQRKYFVLGEYWKKDGAACTGRILEEGWSSLQRKRQIGDDRCCSEPGAATDAA